MKIFPKTFVALLGVSLLMAISCGSPSTEIQNLRVAYAEKPLAIEDKNPLFGWQMKSDIVGQEQQGYQIKVAKQEGRTVRNGIEVGIYKLSSGTYEFQLENNEVKAISL